MKFSERLMSQLYGEFSGDAPDYFHRTEIRLAAEQVEEAMEYGDPPPRMTLRNRVRLWVDAQGGGWAIVAIAVVWFLIACGLVSLIGDLT